MDPTVGNTAGTGGVPTDEAPERCSKPDKEVPSRPVVRKDSGAKIVTRPSQMAFFGALPFLLSLWDLNQLGAHPLFQSTECLWDRLATFSLSAYLP